MTSAARTIEPALLKRTEAATWLGISARHFSRIKNSIPAVVVGKQGRRYDPEDLKQWAAENKHRGASNHGKAQKRCKSTSATPANDTVSPQAAEILQRLRSKPHASTPRLFPVGESKSSKAKLGE